jgi:cellulose synthase/poly-beta-1,6-N-acetylglucosamine synthase-like glycosyltransferase
MNAAEIVFWLCSALILYTYFGYPALIRVLARLWPRPVIKRAIHPRVSFIIAAFNEEKIIASKLENTLALAWPLEELEIIVAADGSNDGTTGIASRYRENGVTVLHRPEREGKTQALNHAVEEASGEILFFSDANTMYEPSTLALMIRNFADPSVGGVSGRKVVLSEQDREATQGESAYWNYETSLKQAESLFGSIVTADGEIFAMRRSLFDRIPKCIVHDDMYLTLKIVEKGYRVVFEAEATSAEAASHTLHDEFHLKVRYASAGYQIVVAFKQLLLNPARWFAWEFFSHKLTRWLIPFFLVGTLLASAFLDTPFYRLAFWLQVLFYCLALLGGLLPKRGLAFLFYFPWYFSVMNTAALYGFARYFTIGQTPLWRKAQR